MLDLFVSKDLPAEAMGAAFAEWIRAFAERQEIFQSMGACGIRIERVGSGFVLGMEFRESDNHPSEEAA